MNNRKLIFARSNSVEDASQETPVLRGPQPDTRFSLLVDALKTHDLPGVRSQLARGLSVNHQEAAKGNRTPLIYAVKHDFLEAVDELLKRGAGVGVSDANGVTPLHMAAVGGHLPTIRLLLSQGASPDSIDTHSRTPLHYAARAANQDPSDRGVIGVVETLLKVGANRRRLDQEGRIPLHNAATAGSAKLIKVLVDKRSTETMNMKDNEGRTPLHCAVLGARSLEAVYVLLQLGCTIDARDAQGHTAMHLVAARPVNHVDDEFDGACLELLLSKGASVAAKDDEGYNALSLALRRTMWWGRPAARDYVQHAVQILVSKGSSIQDGFAMWRMVESFPSLVPAALNRSFCSNTSVRDSQHLRLDFDFGPLTADAKQLREIHRQSPLNPQSELPPPLLKDTEVSMLHYILWAGRKSLLKHPLCHTFLHLKWYKVRKYFIANVMFYLLFVLSLTAFLLSTENCPESSYNTSSTDYTNNSKENTTETSCLWAGNEAGLVGLSWWCLTIFSSLLTLREVVQMCQSPLLYIRNIGNLFDATLVVCVPQLLVIGFANGDYSTNATCCLATWQQKVGAIAIILAWVRLMLFTGQFPSCGVYIVMFSTVAKNVLKFLSMYIFLLVAFSLGFYVLLKNGTIFQNPGISFVTSLVMMTGELDYKSTFLENGHGISVLSIFILVVFIVLIFIILSNLLVGLAVSDMYAIRQRSEVLRLTRHVELMAQVEALFQSRLLPAGLQRCLLNNISLTSFQQKPSVSVFPNRTIGFIDALFLLLSKFVPSRKYLVKIFEIFVSGFIPPEHEPSLPKELLNEAVNISLREHELDKRDRLLHLRSLQSGVGGPHKSIQMQPSNATSQMTGTRRNSLSRSASILAPRNSWRWTFISDIDTDDVCVEDPHPTLQPQPSIMSTWLAPPATNLRPIVPDQNARMDELRAMISSLQSTLEHLSATVHQQSTNRQTLSPVADTEDVTV